MRVWRQITAWVQRFFPVPGLLLASGDPVLPDYSVDNAMSTLARFPYVWVCAQAISTDLAGRPFVAVSTATSGPPRPNNRKLVDDPVLRLLEQPNAGTDGPLFIAQLVVDRLLTGNAYVWAPEGRNSVAIYRLHPKWVHVIPGPLGVAAGYEVEDPDTGTRRRLPPEQVLHIRGVSWQDHDRRTYGESAIRCLHDDLSADLGARKTLAKLAAKGRPDILFSVKSGIGDNLTARIQQRWEQAIRSLHGAFVIGADVVAQVLSWSPKDFGETERAVALRDTVLSVFGVPPTRANIPGANYGASRQEMRVYWESLQGRAREFERAFSRLARPGVRIEFDFTAVEALQVSYTERLMRVSTWVGLGASPKAAAEYEGFDEAPVAETVQDFHSPRPIDRQPEEPQDDRERALGPVLQRHLAEAEHSYGELGGEVDRSLFARFQSVRLFGALRDAGIDADQARWWAEEIAAITDEGHRMGVAGVFGAERAQRLAQQIESSLRTREAA